MTEASWVADHLARIRQEGLVDLSALDVHPGSDQVACLAQVRPDATGPTEPRLVVGRLPDDITVLGPAGAPLSGPRWSPSGERLAVIVDRDGVPAARVFRVDRSGPGLRLEPERTSPAVGGAVESVRWSPDGSRLLLVVAQFGAELSDVHGSGTIAAGDRAESWRPRVLPAPDQGRRLLHSWQVDADRTVVLAPELNAWEACWYGDQVVAVASEEPGEGAWYGARLVAVSADGGWTELHRPERQVARPEGSPGGRRWAALTGRASDRGLLAGDLVVGTPTGAVACGTAGVDVTDLRWVDDDLLLCAGTRRHQTVFLLLDLGGSDGRGPAVTELLATDATSGRHQPELGGLTGTGSLVTILERHDRPPAVAVTAQGRTTPVLTTDGPGTGHLRSITGRTTPYQWTSTDGQEIGGLLTLPAGRGPFPLVVNVHGGPVAAWHDGWLGRDLHTALLVARGYAVLRPNPRGSTGRGQAFIESVVGDMGGRDVDDLVTGVEALVAEGLVDRARVGITGNSYGGYMAAWVPACTDLFAASVARSPVTDFVSQHLTSNLPEFDLDFVGGDPFDPDSNYARRNPVAHVGRIRTPMLLTAGALDLATPAFQAHLLHSALRRTGVATSLAIYPEEGHGVRGERALTDQLARTIAWFDTHL